MTQTGHSDKKPVAISEEDQKAFADIARDMLTRVRAIKSVSRRFGNRTALRHGIIIVQDPDNPDTVQICTEIVTPSGDGFEIACWCTPPGICSEGPCGGILV